MRNAVGTSHLLLKGRTHYFRYAVPKGCQKLLGRRELRISLCTGYIDDARRKAKRLALTAHEVFTSIRQGRLSRMNADEVRYFVDRIFRMVLEQNEHHAVFGIPDYPEGQDYVRGDTEQRAAFLKGLLARRDYTTLDGYVDTLFEDLGFDAPTDPQERRMLAHEIGKHLANYYDILAHRGRGDYAFEKTIYPPLPESREPLSAVVQPSPPTAPAKKLSEVIEEYVQDQTLAGNWTERSTGDIVSTLANLTDILGDVPVSGIDFAAMRTFKTTLMQLPPNRKKAREYRDKSIEEILRAAPRKRLGKTTFNNIVTNIRAFSNGACGMGT